MSFRIDCAVWLAPPVGGVDDDEVEEAGGLVVTGVETLEDDRLEAIGVREERDGVVLDVHHKKPFKTFGYVPGMNENYKQANALGNLVTLCKACHGKSEQEGARQQQGARR